MYYNNLLGFNPLGVDVFGSFKSLGFASLRGSYAWLTPAGVFSAAPNYVIDFYLRYTTLINSTYLYTLKTYLNILISLPVFFCILNTYCINNR